MGKPLDLVGMEFSRWTVIGKSANKGPRGEIFWKCRCACGIERDVKASSLTQGKSRSCGCYHKDALSSHGWYGTPTHKSWDSMKQRCLNPNSPDYPRYGGAGIMVCAAWAESFEAFLTDMGERPAGTTLDRKDVNGGYEPGNCRWADASTQQRNRKCMEILSFNGSSMTLPEWAERTEIPAKVIRWRLDAGWPVEQALTTPKRRKSPDGSGRYSRGKSTAA